MKDHVVKETRGWVWTPVRLPPLRSVPSIWLGRSKAFEGSDLDDTYSLRIYGPESLMKRYNRKLKVLELESWGSSLSAIHMSLDRACLHVTFDVRASINRCTRSMSIGAWWAIVPIAWFLACAIY
jgi:hypothetical protein